jgi:hypothetical protein
MPRSVGLSMANEVRGEIALEERKNKRQRGSRMAVQIDGNLHQLVDDLP